MQDLSHRSREGFEAVIYYEKNSNSVSISYEEIEKKNEEALVAQMLKIRAEMVDIEDSFIQR